MSQFHDDFLDYFLALVAEQVDRGHTRDEACDLIANEIRRQIRGTRNDLMKLLVDHAVDAAHLREREMLH
jgi:hypothetical protein